MVEILQWLERRGKKVCKKRLTCLGKVERQSLLAWLECVQFDMSKCQEHEETVHHGTTILWITHVITSNWFVIEKWSSINLGSKYPFQPSDKDGSTCVREIGGNWTNWKHGWPGTDHFIKIVYTNVKHTRYRWAEGMVHVIVARHGSKGASVWTLEFTKIFFSERRNYISTFSSLPLIIVKIVGLLKFFDSPINY